MWKRVAAAAATLYIGALVALATGTIDSSGASIATGAAGVAGTVLIDPCRSGGSLPAVPAPVPPPALGSMTDSMGTFPGAGNGAQGDFTTGSDMVLDPGTYQHTAYTVNSDAVVTYNGTTTILVQGDMFLRGSIVVPPGDGGLVIRVGGDLILLGGDEGSTNRRIQSDGGSLTIDVRGRCRLGDDTNPFSRASLLCDGGSLTLRVFGQGGQQQPPLIGAVPGYDFSAALRIGDCPIQAPAGSVVVRSALGISATGERTEIRSGAGASPAFLYVQAYGGDVVLEEGVAVRGGFSGGLVLVEASAGVSIDSGTVLTDGAEVEISAFGGDVGLRFTEVDVPGGAPLTVKASADVYIDRTGLETGNGALAVYASTGSICIDCDGNQPLVVPGNLSSMVSQGGAVDLRAGQGVQIFGPFHLDAAGGDATIDAVAAGISMSGSGVSIHGTGDVALRSGLRVDAQAAPSVSIGGASVLVAARGTGGIDIPSGSLGASSDALRMMSVADLRFGGSGTGSTAVGLVSTTGDVLASGVTLATDDFGVDGADSGPVTVDSYNPTGFIDVSGATLSTGAGETSSGDISVVVWADAGPPSVQSYFLPKKVNVRLNPKKPEKSRFTAAGFLDTGPGAVDLSGPVTIGLGGASVEVPGLTPNATGTTFAYRGQGLTLLLKASKVGSSRAIFKLKHQADIEGLIPVEGDVTMRFDNGTIEGIGTVHLTAGKYTLGKRRGALREPNLYLSKSKVKLIGGGKDGFTVTLGLATNGVTPGSAPDLSISFGPSFSRSLDGDDFTRSGDRWTYRGSDGITSVVLDYLKETVTVKAKNVELGNFVEGSQRVPLAVTVGTDARAVEVRMGRKGKALRY